MPYRPSEYPRVGPGKYYYILYKNLEQTRSGKKVWKPRAKRVFISGKLVRTERGRVRKRAGEIVKGVKFFYKNTRKLFSAKRGATKYHVKKAEMIVEKVVELPRNAMNIKITDKKSEAQPTLMEVY